LSFSICELPPNVELIDAGVGGMAILSWIEDADKVIIIDSVQTNNEPPGTVYRFTDKELPPSDMFMLSLHDLNLVDTINIGRVVQKMPDEIVIYGVEVKRVAEYTRELTPEVMRELERMITLRVIDVKWIDHLDAMDFLEEGIGLRGYAGVDPLVAFRKEAYTEWETLLAAMQDEIVKLLFRVQVSREQRRPQPSPFAEVHASHGADAEPEALRPTRVKKKVGRNDPCPCGSGRKYKKCCLNKDAGS
jgi:hydrogenase maturation protease